MLSPGSPLFGRAQNDGDTDALQTDVMRFLAIIALCLLAVFAAVSSEMPQSAREMMDVQNNLIESLQNDVQIEQNRHAEVSVRLKEALAQQSALAASDQKDAELKLNVALELEQLKLEATALADALNKSDEQLQAVLAERYAEQQTQRGSREQIAALQAQLQQAQGQRRDDASRLAEMQQQLQQTQRQLDQQLAKAAERSIEQNEPEVVISEASRTDAQAQPLSLHFDNLRALMTLVRGRRIDLLAMSDGQIWRYEPSIRGFESVSSADQVNFINEVPADVAALAAAVSNSAQIQWGVVMDGAMLAQLSELIATVDSGRIVVDSSGGLSHQP